jgi:hypothetical protein
MNNSIIRFGGNDPSEGNHVLRNKYAVEGQSSAIWMENNFMEIGRTVIESPTNAIHENNEVGVYIKKNTWEDSFLLFSAQVLNPPAHVIVNENQFNDTYVRASDLPFSSTEYTVMHSNIFEVSSNYAGSTFLLELTNFEFGQIGNNTFNNNGTVTLTAIQVKDCRDMVLSENEISAFDRGITFVDNNIRAQFSCNVFDGCMTGVYFHNALMSDQGDGSQGADNRWLNDPSGSYRVDGILNSGITYFHRNTADREIQPAFIGSGLSSTFFTDPSPTGTSCFVFAASQKMEPVSIEKSSIYVYPNPFKENLTIEGRAGMTYHIFDMVGKLNSAGTLPKDVSELTLDFAPGFYTLLIHDGINHKIFKLVKQ